MAAFKGILKSMKGGLKYALTAVPALIVATSLAYGINNIVNGSAYEEKFRSYKETDTFQIAYMEDVAAAMDAYKNGEITKAEYDSRLKCFETDSYLRDKIEEDVQHPEYQEAVEKMDESLDKIPVQVISTVALGAGCTFFYAVGAAKKLAKSGNKDFKEAKNEFLNRPKTARGATKFSAGEFEEDLPTIDEDYL